MALVPSFINNYSTVLSNSITDADTTIVVAHPIPFLTGSNCYILTIFNKDGVLEKDFEIIQVTSVGSDNRTLTVTRGLEGTTPRSYTTGTKVELRLTAGALTTSLQDILTKSTAVPTNVSYTYNSNGQVSSITENLVTGLRTTSFTYNSNGQTTQMVQTHNGLTRTTSYTYDSNNVLIGYTVTES